MMKKLITLLLGLLAAVLALSAQAPKNVLWFDKPAQAWEEAWPVGNGRIGAMVYGGTAEEEIQLNEETISTGGPYENWNPNGLKNLQKIRDLIFAGRYEDAQKLGALIRIEPSISLGLDRHAVRALHVDGVVDRGRDDLDPASPEDVDYRDRLKLLESVCQRHQDFRHTTDSLRTLVVR